MLGLRYLNDLARKQGMPLVICVALGTSFGGHNGDSILADILDIYATVRNRCVVVGTGNEAAEDITILTVLRMHRIQGQQKSG